MFRQGKLFSSPRHEWDRDSGEDKKVLTKREAPDSLEKAVLEDDPDFVPVIADRPFAVLAGWFAMGKGSEIMFNFRLLEASEPLARQSLKHYNNKDRPKPSHVITYVAFVMEAEGGPGSVTVDGESSARQQDKQSVETNGQGHTHPGIGTFWSATDLGDQAQDMGLLPAFLPEGERYFIVMDATEILLRRYRWWRDDEGELQIRYTDTYVRNSVGEMLDNAGRSKWRRKGGTRGGYITTITADPMDILERMEYLPGLYDDISSEEEARVMNHLYYTYGEEIFSLPTILDEEDDDLLKVVNTLIFVLSEYGIRWQDVFAKPESWAEQFGSKEVSR